MVIRRHHGHPIELLAAYVPTGGNVKEKPATLEALASTLETRRTFAPRILCGDLNTPQAELPHGGIATFGQARRADGTWRTVNLGHDKAERRLIQGLRSHGFFDAYRLIHGSDGRDATWRVPRRPEIGYRLDHVLIEEELDAVQARYLHEFRDRGLSDHSPLLVNLVDLRGWLLPDRPYLPPDDPDFTFSLDVVEALEADARASRARQEILRRLRVERWRMSGWDLTLGQVGVDDGRDSGAGPTAPSPA